MKSSLFLITFTSLFFIGCGYKIVKDSKNEQNILRLPQNLNTLDADEIIDSYNDSINRYLADLKKEQNRADYKSIVTPNREIYVNTESIVKQLNTTTNRSSDSTVITTKFEVSSSQNSGFNQFNQFNQSSDDSKILDVLREKNIICDSIRKDCILYLPSKELY